MKQKQFKKIITIIVGVSMVSLFGFPPLLQNAQAVDSIVHASDRLSDSDMSQIATHTISVTTTHNIDAGGKIEYTLPAGFSIIGADGDITCQGLGAESRSGGNRTAVCTYAAGLVIGQATTTIANITNPAAAGSQVINVTSYDSTGTILERVQIRVAIISDVWMTATVDATLTFTINGLADTETVNGVDCDMDTTATTTPFGTLNVNTPTTVCQELVVATNASEGFNVTVWEDNEMETESGSNINSFDNSPDGTGSSTKHAWAAPAGILDNYSTYGHMGLTADDASLSNGDAFGASLYAGFTGTTPIEVMYHTGPSDGTDVDRGLSKVAYTAEISALQEAGDYENTLTYIATPIY
jgi:hypothetical protein